MISDLDLHGHDGITISNHMHLQHWQSETGRPPGIFFLIMITGYVAGQT
jgi:hypothetical protein